MPAETAREIRVFLSSTFRDMDAERDYLLKHVFPELRRECAQRNVGFVEIDLRWGVTEEASKNGKTVEICLTEIDRCRDYPPFFIGFLGERYGWIPEERDLTAYWNSHAGSSYAVPIRRALEQRISVTELEMQFAVFDHLAGPRAADARFYLRDRALTEQLARASDAPSANFYDESHGKLQLLRERIRATGLVDMDGYRTLEEFGERVRALLLAGLDQRYPAASTPSPVQRRAHAHAHFAASRRLGYVPLPSLQDAVANALQAQLAAAPAQRQHVYLAGPSGAGKSAFMAALEVWLPSRVPGSRIFASYSGADGGVDIGLWRDDLTEHLGGQVEPASAADNKSRWDRLADQLRRAGAGPASPVFLLVDAIDLLDAPDQALRMLATQPWPIGVVAIVSGLPEWTPESGYVTLGLAPASPAHRQAMIEAFNARYRKGLAPALTELLANDDRAGSPLFLYMVLEELRVQARHETLERDVRTMLALPDADALFRHLLERWDRDFDDINHPALVSRLAGFLALSRNGLDENELADLLAAPNDPISPRTGKPRLPAARLSPLLAILRPYLLRHEGRERLMHAALQRGATPAAVVAVRILLIRYFVEGEGQRMISERLYQALRLVQHAPQDHERLDLLMGTLLWIGNVYRLVDVDLPLARDALTALGAGSPSTNTRAARLGISWAEQLHEYQSASQAGRVSRWFAWLGKFGGRKRSQHAEPRGLYPTCRWVEHLAEWAFVVPALPLAEAAVQIAAAADPGKTPVLARCWYALSSLHLRSGRLDAAQDCAAKALAASKANAVADARGPALYGVALSLQAQGRSEEALNYIGEALVQLRAHASENQDIANALGLLGVIQTRLGRFADAEVSLLEAQSMRTGLLPPGDPELAIAQIELADFYKVSGQYERAAACYEQCLASQRRTLSPSHPLLATTQASLGNLYRSLSRFAEARPLLEAALTLHRATLAPNHLDLGADLINLGLLYQELGELDKAKAAFDEGLAIARRAVPPGHDARLRALINTGLCYEALDQRDHAATLIMEAVAEAQATLAPGHPDIAWALGQLGFIREKQGQWDEAARLQADVLARRRATLPAGHPDIADTLVRCAALHAKSHRFSQAEAAYTDALDILRASYPQGHLDSLYALNNFGAIYLAQGNAAKAVPLFDEALALARHLLPPRHWLLLESLRVLGVACQSAGLAYRAQACLSELERLQDSQAA
ncbi:tetratricopeptide repeat protein [Massilia sp. LXY-6]|uniref:tetratricopeptide repeat protein n=1 Tax=Massilia sp. LXY-6 TaxID=3379823 RepID=UPI003EE2AE72